MAVMTFEETLAAWLPGQRWFAGKGTPITDLGVAVQTTLVGGDPGLRHLIVDVTQATGTDSYQLFLGLRADLPDRLEHVRIGPAGQGLTGYDALHDPDLTAILLAAIAAGQTIGPLHFAQPPGGHIDTGPESLVLTAEQSNTSLLFGEEAILKVFRRLSPGPNPDLEVPDALARLGSRHVAAPLGWITAETQGLPTVLALLSKYLRNAVDGWSMAATSVRDLYASGGTNAAQAGGDFTGEAHRLGEATAEVHRDLAAGFQLVGQEDTGQAAAAARDWARRNQVAFCAGYARAGGADPGKHGILVRALTLDKAVYEVMYEARNRPSWLPIPLGSIADGAA